MNPTPDDLALWEAIILYRAEDLLASGLCPPNWRDELKQLIAEMKQEMN